MIYSIINIIILLPYKMQNLTPMLVLDSVVNQLIDKFHINKFPIRKQFAFYFCMLSAIEWFFYKIISLHKKLLFTYALWNTIQGQSNIVNISINMIWVVLT